MAEELRWEDAEDIGLKLADMYPEQNPLEVRFTDLHKLITGLPTFVDDPGKVDRGQTRGHPNGMVRGVPGSDAVSGAD